MPAYPNSDYSSDEELEKSDFRSRSAKRRTVSLSRGKKGFGDTFSAEEFKDVFKLFDQTQDGLIGTDELYNVFRNFNFSFTHRQIDRLIASGDKDGNGTLDAEEFISLMKTRVDNKGLPRQSWTEDLKEAFEEIDNDRNGTITAEELVKTMQALGEDLTVDDINFVMDQIDLDNTGTIDFSEFREMMESTTKKEKRRRSRSKTPKRRKSRKKKKKKRRKSTSSDSSS